jgi:hypothetical protein
MIRAFTPIRAESIETDAGTDHPRFRNTCATSKWI